MSPTPACPPLPFLIVSALLLSAMPAQAQSWSAPVNLGVTSSSGASLAMNRSGSAIIAWGYAVGQNPGTVGYAQTLAGQPWTSAFYGFSAYDASDPGVGLDDGGTTTLIFNGGQIDNYSSVIQSFTQAGFTGNWLGSGSLGVNVTMSSRPQVLFYPSGSTYVAEYLISIGCNLEAGTLAHGYEQTLTDSGDCVSGSQLAIGGSGVGAVLFKTKGGLVRAAARSSSGQWSATTTLAPKGTLPPASVTAVTSTSGESTLAWSIGKSGGRSFQVWAATVASDGSFGTPLELSSNACTPAVAAVALPDGSTVVAYGHAVKRGSCEATLATRPASGSFGTAVAVTSGAHTTGLTAAVSASGTVVLAWNDTTKGGLYATSGSGSRFATPVKVGPSAAPILAAGGSYASLAWCSTNCFASSAVIP